MASTSDQEDDSETTVPVTQRYSVYHLLALALLVNLGLMLLPSSTAQRVWKGTKATISNRPIVSLYALHSSQFRQLPTDCNYYAYYVGFSPEDPNDDLGVSFFTFLGTWELYPHRLYTTTHDIPIVYAHDMLHYNNPPDRDWLRKHNVGGILKISRNNVGLMDFDLVPLQPEG